MGTACQVRSAPKILETTERILGIKTGETTSDYNFTLESVNCLGCCALGPVMVINNEYYGKLVPSEVNEILGKYRVTSRVKVEKDE